MRTYFINLPKELVAQVLYGVLPVTSPGWDVQAVAALCAALCSFLPGSLIASLFLSFLPSLTSLLPQLV